MSTTRETEAKIRQIYRLLQELSDDGVFISACINVDIKTKGLTSQSFELGGFVPDYCMGDVISMSDIFVDNRHLDIELNLEFSTLTDDIEDTAIAQQNIHEIYDEGAGL